MQLAWRETSTNLHGRAPIRKPEDKRLLQEDMAPPPTLRVVPVNASGLGCDIEGVDLSRALDDETFAAIEAAWTRHGVIRVRGQTLSDADQVRFSRRFGELDEAPVMEGGQTSVPGCPEIYVVSNVLDEETKKPIGSLGSGEAVWHTDMSYLAEPPKASSLYALELPRRGGGSTWFCDCYAAYESLPAELARRVAGKRVKHDGTHNSGGFLRAGAEEVTDPSKSQGTYHPAVVTHPDSRRKCLYLGRRPFAYVEGLSLADSEALLDDLWAWVTQPQFAWEHQWQLGDLVLWDNRYVLFLLVCCGVSFSSSLLACSLASSSNYWNSLIFVVGVLFIDATPSTPTTAASSTEPKSRASHLIPDNS